jgi:hypothetical protein
VLRLVEKGDSVVSFDEATALAEERDLVCAEAAEIEAAYGKNAYSDFLAQHGHYPDPKQAATIGKLTGMRVKASNGSMQPRRTKAEREVVKAIRKQRRERARYGDQISRLLHAISGLAANADAPEDVLLHVHPQFDDPIIREHLSDAVEWLIRFAKEWNRREDQTNDKISRAAQGDRPR